MSRLAHQIYIGVLTGIVVAAFLTLAYIGSSYYGTSLEERYYHPQHDFFKPSGAFGHGLGIIGTLLILIGVFSYIARKRYQVLARFGRLKYWLEFHIFLCSLGPIMILFHTAFKFGGIVSVSFWSMVAVVASGVIGRFIYIQIPRSIEGRELSLAEVRQMKMELKKEQQENTGMEESQIRLLFDSARVDEEESKGNLMSRIIRKYFQDQKAVRGLKAQLRQAGISKTEQKYLVRLFQNELALNNKIDRLQTMQQLFKYWHVAHLPFAFVMLIIMVIHVAITLAFGYRWIF